MPPSATVAPTSDAVISKIRAHESELKAEGVLGVSLFGSVARGSDHPNDIHLAVRLASDFSTPGFAYFARLEELEARFTGMLGTRVDIVEEPVRKPRLQQQIDRDRLRAF